MSWENILKLNEPSSDDISFMQEMLDEVLSKVGSIYGLVPKLISDYTYKRFPQGYYYSPEAVIEYAFAVGFEPNADGFVVGESDTITAGADWEDLWGYGFKDKIMNLPEQYRDLGSKEDYPVYQYIIGAYNYDLATIGIHVKKENPQIESLAIDIHKKFKEKYGEGKESSYKPMFNTAYSPEEDRLVNIDEVEIKDGWKDSLRGKE